MKIFPRMALPLLLAACHAPPSELPASEVLRFGVGHRDGSVGFVVRSDGSAEYKSEGGPEGAVVVSGKVPPEELEKLAVLLEENGFCSLVSTRSTGVPDEARPSAAVRLRSLDCRVEMWDGEFRDDAGAKAALAAIEAVGSKIRSQGK